VSDLAEVRDELHVVARDLLGKAGPGAEPGWDVLADSGWLGIEVPDELGGADATFAEVAVIAEELGRAATRAPYLGAIVLGVGALRAAAPCDGRDELLAQVAAGEALPVALVTDYPAFRLTQGPGGRLRLNGEASFVPDAADASRLLAVAYPGDGDPVVVTLNPRAPGLVISATPVLDETRGLAEVRAGDVEVAREEVWRFSGDPHAAVQRLLDRASVALACDSLGVAQAMLDTTVAYVKVRQQFGRPVGSFQAVKHACADMLVQLAVARELVAAAVAALAEPLGEPGAVEASVAASMAKAYTGTAAVDIAGKAMQLHGGVGYAREAGIHAYLKRAALNRDLFGTPIAHRARLAGRYRSAAARA
jgi:alkylation response protein AidB-like acyl-CoA dehydrogenase